MVALNVAFWLWCLALGGGAVFFYRQANASSGDATGGLADMLGFMLVVGLLILSLIVRGIVWWVYR